MPLDLQVQKLEPSKPLPVSEFPTYYLVDQVYQELTDTSLFVAPELLDPSAAISKMYGNMRYPQDAREKQKEGIVYLELWINEQGIIEQIIRLNSIYPSIDAEAHRAVSELLWDQAFSPALYQGIPIRSRQPMPMRFTLH